MDSEKEARRSTRLDRITKLLRPRPGRFMETHEQLLHLRVLVHEHIADLVSESLNRELEVAPQETIEEKRVLARWVNAAMRDLSLAICAPGGLPAIVHASPGDPPNEGRFQLELLGGTHGRRRFASSSKLQNIQPMPYLERGNRFDALWRRGVSGHDESSGRS